MSEGELGGFGDARLRAAGAALLEALQGTSTVCLHALAKDRNQALRFDRFLENDAVTSGEMLTHAGRLTGVRAAGRAVLAIQDTTELHFEGHAASKRGFGTAGNGTGQGLFLHPVIAVDAATGGVIGLVGATVINRTEGKAAARRGRAADAKESRRWLEGAETAAAALEDAASITMVADRESDVYDQFARRPASVHLLCRAAQDRGLADGGRLFSRIAAWPEQYCYTISVPSRGTRPARAAKVVLRFGEVSLRRPDTAGRALAEAVTVRVVDVAEIDPPQAAPQAPLGDGGGDAAVHWRLLTTHDVSTLDQALRLVAWYQARWTIEQVFRTLKSAGTRAEQSQVVQARRFVKLATAALIAAVRVMQIVIGRDGSTGQSLADAADPDDAPMLKAVCKTLEGRTEKLKNPHAPDTLAWFAWIVGRLGGWSGYTSRGYKPPGPKTINRGLTKLDAMTEGWKLAHSADV